MGLEYFLRFGVDCFSRCYLGFLIGKLVGAVREIKKDANA